MPKNQRFYTVNARYCIPETYRVKAGSKEDALQEYDSTGELIERDEDNGALEVVSVKADNDTLQKAYSVLLAYPNPNDEGQPETYYAHVWAGNTFVAIQRAREEAETANQGSIEQHEFYPLLVLAGHIESAAFGGQKEGK